jgi:hypothetical protein
MNMRNTPETPEKTLHRLAVESIAKSRRSVDRALPKFLALVSEDPYLVVALVGESVVKNAALQYLHDTLLRDMDGGGQKAVDTPWVRAFPTSPETDIYTTVREHPRILPGRTRPKEPSPWSKSDIPSRSENERKPKAPYVAPKERVSAEKQLRTKNIVAASILDTLIVRGKAIGEWRKEEALELAEKMDWDGKVLKAFADPLPPGALVKEYITVREAENIMKTLEANRAA